MEVIEGIKIIVVKGISFRGHELEDKGKGRQLLRVIEVRYDIN
jgi:hypothetical protein